MTTTELIKMLIDCIYKRDGHDVVSVAKLKNIKYQKEIAKLYEMIVIKRNKLISQIRKLELLKKKQII